MPICPVCDFPINLKTNTYMTLVGSGDDTSTTFLHKDCLNDFVCKAQAAKQEEQELDVQPLSQKGISPCLGIGRTPCIVSYNT